VAKKLAWTGRAKADVRYLDAQTAMDILRGLARFLKSGDGDVKRPSDIDPPQFRLRVGAYRVRFYDRGDTIEVLSVEHRSRAYR
jgi:mRNA-degrading endonuclease RelE of RelBE toxin-antitoxin system